ncbi:MAG: transposase [Desulfobulbaceae bacterium]|uniref:Transposase n=1 Tax=Candidatus Desulfobia pelagia TaxID=2841692 RepID=A0A8J6NC52_9BACT|nr:transposase [Candidatus Desulfobia pelagia]
MSLTQEVSHGASVYRPRSSAQTSLYKLLVERFDHFEDIYPERFTKSHGFYRQVISHVVRNYLWCGDLTQGFARVRCPDCHHEYLLAFSCRGRWFCPSCHEKKVVQFGEQLRENILYPLPHRQYVFSIPIILRKIFLYNRKLLSILCKAAADSLLIFLRTVTGLKDGIVGAVMTIQTFGDYARWHPHIHAIVADGLFRRNGVFYVMPKTSLKPLAELFRGRLLQLLVKEGVIDNSFVAMLMKWKHTSGFNVDNSVRIAKGDEKGITALAQYIIRNAFSMDKLSYNRDTGMVVYRSKMTHGKNKKNFSISTADEFIADITQHIPDKSFQLVRYYGWYSNRMRGERRKLDGGDCSEEQKSETIDISKLTMLDVKDYKPRRIPPPLWRECIKKVWEVDPLICPHCQAEMKIISFIVERKVIRKILTHLKLWSGNNIRGSPFWAAKLKSSSSHSRHERYYEPVDDGWPGYEEPVYNKD